jgi:hypothetical protein
MPTPSLKVAQIAAAFVFVSAAMNSLRAQELDATLDSSRWDGLSIKYPGSLFTIFRPEGDPQKDQEDAPTADPDVLRSNDGAAELLLGGDYNGLSLKDAKAYLDRLLAWQEEKRPSVAVNYRSARDDWAVASGTFGDRIFYYKVVSRCEDDARHCEKPETFASAEFDYAAEKRDLYDKLVVEMSGTLTTAIPPD